MAIRDDEMPRPDGEPPDDPRPVLDRLDVQRTRASVKRALFGGQPELTRIGRFVVLGNAGAGAMGVVLSAWDPTLDRKVAIKRIRASDPADAERLRARLLREAKALARIRHANVVDVYEVGTIDDDVYVAMELIEGLDLRRWLAIAPRSRAEILGVFIAAGRGLAAAHAVGLVHRDFKPDNVLVGATALAQGGELRVRVADFGLASSSFMSTEGGEAVPSSPQSTSTGALAGTPAYMAPEQTRGDPIDARCDQFAYCVALHEALFGARPFTPPDYAALARWRPPAHADPVPSHVVDVLARGLALDPAARFAGMDALVDALAVDARARSRRHLAIAGLALGIVGAGVVWRSVGEPPCRGVELELDETWSAARGERVAAAFVATGASYADSLLAPSLARLDRQAAEWTAARVDVCERALVRGDQSQRVMQLRNACLDARRHQLAAIADIFESADAKVLERVPLLVASLDPIGPCNDAGALLAGTDEPAAELALEVDAVRRSIADARASERVGRPHEALAQAEAAVQAADATAYDPVRAEARNTHGLVLAKSGRDADAHAMLRDALDIAEAAGHDRAKLLAWIELAALALDGKDAQGLADHYIRSAAATADRLGRPARELVLIAHRRARLAALHGDHELAHELLADAIGLVDTDADPMLAIAVLQMMGNSSHELARYRDADDEYSRGLALFEQTAGSEHPVLAGLLTNIGANMIREGRPAEAVEPLRRAVALRRAAFGDSNPLIAEALNNLASAHYSTGEYETALVGYREALAINERTYGDRDARLVNALANVGRTEVLLDRADAGVAALGRALELATAAHGEQHAVVADVHSGLAFALERAGRDDDALVHVRAALEIRSALLGADNSVTAQSRVALARLLADRDQLAEATEHAAAAVVALDRGLGGEHPALAVALVTKGRVAVLAGEPAVAVASLERAVAIFGDERGHPEERAEARFWLARARHESGASDAVAEAEKAIAAMRHAGPTAARRATRMEAELAAWRGR